MSTDRLWEMLRDLGGSFSAVGSFAALVAGVVLARRQASPRLYLEADLRTPRARGDAGSPDASLLWLVVTNRGSRPITIQQIAWSFRFPDRRVEWTPPTNRLTTALPVTLADGRSANFVQPIDAFAASLGTSLRAQLGGRAGWICSHAVEVQVIARTGERFCAALRPALRSELLRIARARPGGG